MDLKKKVKTLLPPSYIQFAHMMHCIKVRNLNNFDDSFDGVFAVAA